jgi:tripartite-type tricarboxylate transporter receptor subunit TctC
MYRILSLLWLGWALVGNAAAQDFPSRPVMFTVPFAAGGPADVIARILANGMSKVLNQQFVVENTVGAGGTIGTAKVASSPPDGYSLLLMHISHAANVAFYSNLRYDPVKDFEPIGLVAESPMAIVARKDFPASNFNEFVAYLLANNEKVTYGFAGIGSASHLCSLLFFHAINTTVNGAPYKGTAPALTDLLGGHLDFMCDQTINVLQPAKSGLVKAFAATTPQRLKVAPELPTIADSGLPDFQMVVWYAMYAPKGTPRPIIDKLSAALQKALQDPDVQERLAQSGAETVPPERARPDVLRDHLKAEIDRWCRSSGRPVCWRSEQSGRRALNDPQRREGLRRFNADGRTPRTCQVFQRADRPGVWLGPHIELIELKRLEFKIENGRDLDEERRVECVTEPGRSPVGAGRDLVGVELAHRTSRYGPQRRGRCPIGGLVIDVQVATVSYIHDARPQSANRALDGADGVRQGDHIAVVLRQSDKLRRLRAEQVGSPARCRAPF